ncbi:uncharacterized protein [Nicotiana tomentosiformis]|uniref:uncharacterized protein n=1 Tax=Nicotiana tomentosiformis TaxID=4098 RepID=UPI00051B4429|nr:uncharacterized protein LOC117273691 [Nicotiana tomentosiformis]
MDKIMKSQVLKFLLIATLLLITPLLSSSQRTPYLYFIVNLLIISLGAEAGLISSKSPHDNNSSSPDIIIKQQQQQQIISPSVTKVVEKCASEKIVGVTKVLENDAVKLLECPSTPSLFFIASNEDSEAKDHEIVKEEFLEDEEIREISEQELFNKAETFIGNFYMQLKMQREESWQRLHDFSQRAF